MTKCHDSRSKITHNYTNDPKIAGTLDLLCKQNIYVRNIVSSFIHSFIPSLDFPTINPKNNHIDTDTQIHIKASA